ncbi:acyl carrier protein [Streptomyces sp. NPDC001941]|uniref:acyl carrier protein n=1 Tax=Streptomyces sp. NPDC001941 TaxID=3154659 RepID=UPI0033270F2E
MTSSLPPQPSTADVAGLVRTAWADGLGHAEFHDDEHFFQVGGHSMCAVRIVRALKKELDIQLTVRQFFAHPTVAELALFLHELVSVPDARTEAGA